MSFAPRTPADLDLKERIRVAYYDEARPVPEVVVVSGVGRSTMYKWFHAWGWPLRRVIARRARPRRRGPVFLPGGADAPASGIFGSYPAMGAPGTGWQSAPRESLKRRLARLVEHRIAILEHEAMAGIAVDLDANARAIEINARTLVTIEKLGETAGMCSCGDDRPARSPTQLRDELFARLQQIWAEEREAAELAPEA